MLKTDYKFGQVYPLTALGEADEMKVAFQDIMSNENGGVSLLTFKTGQGLTTHIAPAEVMVYVVEGEIEFTMYDTPHLLQKGEFLLMGKDVPHSVVSNGESKVLLIKIKG